MSNFSENALKVLGKRYYRFNEKTPEECFMRVAKCIASKEKDKEYWINKFYDVMINRDFLPNSPTIMNAGTNMKVYSACFVIPIHDDMSSIFDCYKYAAIVSKYGGGTGFNFGELRPKGSKVGTTNGAASGVISWMKIQDIATDQVKQGGVRRGANMGVLPVSHPEIIDFIKCKRDNESLTNFNISVAVDDKFMQAVENDEEYDLIFNSKVYDTIKARKLFDLICENAWANGDPGIIFIDEINRYNPTPHMGKFSATNPCGKYCHL